MSLLQQGDQNWTQYFTCGLTSAKKRGRIPSVNLLGTLFPMQAVGLRHHKGRLLAHGQLVHQDNQILFCQAALQLVIPQLGLMPVVIPP